MANPTEEIHSISNCLLMPLLNNFVKSVISSQTTEQYFEWMWRKRYGPDTDLSAGNSILAMRYNNRITE